MAGRWPSPDISPGHPRSLGDPRQEPIVYCEHRVQFGRRGYAELWRVLGGHIGHARLANRMIYWLRRSSSICLAQSSAIIPRPDEISGLAPAPDHPALLACEYVDGIRYGLLLGQGEVAPEQGFQLRRA